MSTIPLPPEGFGPLSQTLPGAPPAPPAPKKSHKKLWITLSVVLAVLIVLGGGGAFALIQYFGPASAAGAFCGDMQAKDYSAAYGLFTKNLQSQFTQTQFTQGVQTLDTIEGTVTNCGTASGSAYNYSFGGSTASVTAVIKRATAGSLEGLIHLKNEDGGWKVDALDTSLLGINLNALYAASSFCGDLQTQDYSSAYGVLGSSQTDLTSQQAFVKQGQWHDQIDGTVTTCALTSIATGADDTQASLGVSITRTKLGIRQGNVNFDVEDSAWKIDAMDQTLLGTDLGPLTVGTQFCADLASSNYADAYAISSDNFKGGLTEAQFAASLTLPNPYAWGGCTPDLTTYKVPGDTASYTVALNILNNSTGQSISGNVSLEFVDAGGSWLLDNIVKA